MALSTIGANQLVLTSADMPAGFYFAGDFKFIN